MAATARIELARQDSAGTSGAATATGGDSARGAGASDPSPADAYQRIGSPYPPTGSGIDIYA